MVISLFSSSHDKYMQSPGESSHAYYLLLKSDLFRYHSERMINLILAEAEENTNPHTLFILYNILLLWGSKHHSLFRSHRRWKRLSRGLGDVFDAEIDERSVDSDGNPPIEARLRLPATQLMYEVLRVQKLSAEELEGFTDDFIDRLFELVETSRNFDEELNYAVIRLIIALNEQFMVASAQSVVPKQGGLKPPEDPSHGLLSPTPAAPDARTLLSPPPEHLPPSMAPTTRNHHRAHSNLHPPLHVEETKGKNRVLGVLMSRLGNSKTFGENVIFMLNRCQNTPDDLCVQLLLLKILYLLFTTAGTQEYFYTNDLRVLVDVFLRELVDLPEESEACRHTYLRVLHPLLTNTQLKSEPYKHPQIRLVLLSLTSHSHIREVDPTTKRLVERCLNADWGDGGGRGTVVAGLRHIPLTGENEPLSLEANHGHMIVPENVKGMSIDAPAPVEEKAPKMKRGQSLLRKLGRSQR
ncbi:hypothetical protein FFLO_06045 [Filobasidium floriforme]|uniref:SPIN90/Ldb17 leucine-rich domain-containing protein n=2 Tax=Filobasidium floriforme TaxID=5210 RepID=A0A8K0JH30_9TREE|nr:hypothetical protein FFLO_06045 [Filobasidium floriforme]